jgi:flagellar assembly protein FliH
MTATRFTFQREFPETPDGFVPLERKEPTLTVSEHQRLLEAAVASARAEAFHTGKVEAEAEQTARLAEAVEMVARQLDALRAELDAIQAAASQEAICFAHSFSHKLAGKLVEQAPLAAIEAAARAIFEDLRGQAHVAIRVAPELSDAAKEKLTGVARERGFEGRLIVIGEPEIAMGDVRIEWADGGIIRDGAHLEQQIAASIDHAMAAGRNYQEWRDGQ